MSDKSKTAYIYDEDGNAYNLVKEADEVNTAARPKPDPVLDIRSHTHEFLGSTRIAGTKNFAHNHRFAGVTTDVIPIPGGNHVHGLEVNTDSTDHNHEIAETTGPAIILNPLAPPNLQRHVHLVYGTTTLNAGHVHTFIFATLIESPTLPL